MGKRKQIIKQIKFYAVRRGLRTGIFNTWEETKKYTDHYPDNDFKAFDSLAQARIFMNYGKKPIEVSKGPLDKFFEKVDKNTLVLTRKDIETINRLLKSK